MVWLVEKKILYHVFDLGFEGVEIPIRVGFEFEVKEGALVPDSLCKNILYNRAAALQADNPPCFQWVRVSLFKYQKGANLIRGLAVCQIIDP